ncbi:hypothetical protein N7456_001952 [Penicillium angulare]|uniref:Uncharacterized protein n=1 Tax=Penicillium angulare TaxID=116970 RepID=A0A9W9G7R3_9EURO|nr:hypothetical protein N7456_001952 [Penicillium angulare]
MSLAWHVILVLTKDQGDSSLVLTRVGCVQRIVALNVIEISGGWRKDYRDTSNTQWQQENTLGDHAMKFISIRKIKMLNTNNKTRLNINAW